jgi:protein ImuB
MTRILSLVLPTLPTDRLERRGRSSLDEAQPTPPLVTVANINGAQRIAAVDALASANALRPGMGLADARAICRTLRVMQADPQAEAETLRHILDWSRRFTPLAALDPPDGLLLDISGAAHLFGGEMAMIAAAETGLARLGFQATGAIADTLEAAWAMARFGEVRIAPPGPDAFLSVIEPLPLVALRLAGVTIQALAQAGLRRIGDLLMRPRAPIAARFGQALFAQLDGMMGLVKTPIKPSSSVPMFLTERRFAHAITREEALEASIHSLAGHLCVQLDRAGLGARTIEAHFFRVDGAVKRIAVGTSRPLRDPQALALLFHEKLSSLGEDGLDTGYGFDLIRLGASAVEPVASHQAALQTNGAIAKSSEAALALLVDRLGARLGFSRVVRLHNSNQHLPEEAMVERPALRGVETGEATFGDEADLSRPLKLFDRPEPIETIATVPDGPPARFKWRRTTHVIAAIEGPERIAAPWWAEPTPIRDYFHVEDAEGRRFWLFREGIYVADLERPRWFLHGLFG